MRLGGTVPVPTALTVGTYENEAVAGGYFVERWFGTYPCVLIPAISVQEVDNGIGASGVIVVGEHDEAGNGTFHLVAVNLFLYDFCRCSQCDEQKNEGKNLFHVESVVGFCDANLVKIVKVVAFSVSVNGEPRLLCNAGLV